jgi:DNA-binding MarR family transcriptional regulator
VAQWVALRTMYRTGATSVTQLSIAIGVDQGATSRLVDRLVSKGLIERQISRTDRRAATLRLTQAAKKVLPQLAREADKNDQLFFDKLNQRDQELLLRLVKEVIRKNDLRLSALD